jgi:hypothetical protein
MQSKHIGLLDFSRNRLFSKFAPVDILPDDYRVTAASFSQQTAEQYNVALILRAQQIQWVMYSRRMRGPRDEVLMGRKISSTSFGRKPKRKETPWKN